MPRPSWPLRAQPARRATDRYLAWGFLGIFLVAAIVAARILWAAAVPQWHDPWWAAAVFVAGLFPLYASIGVCLHAAATRRDVEQARRRRDHHQEGPPA